MQDATPPVVTIQSVRMAALEAAAWAVKYTYRESSNYAPPSRQRIEGDTVALAKCFEHYIATGA